MVKEAKGGAGRLGRTKTMRAFKSRARPRANSRNLKKTTKRGAYKPARNNYSLRQHHWRY